ncbi:MAG TPA: protein GumC, partial [Desulfobacterales bacterium]|nr:protein GumC [Desulfobacterales bacterium]
MENFDITKYLDMVSRRKWWFIIPFLLVILGGLTFALITPRIYEAKTLILVQPQKVPEDYVRAIISVGVEERLRTITQQVTSRTNLERIIQQYDLYSDEEGMLLDDKVALLREMIKIELSQRRARRGEANAFTISFRHKDPKKAAKVANALASNFIAENLKIREAQALGTSSFLSEELESV